MAMTMHIDHKEDPLNGIYITLLITGMLTLCTVVTALGADTNKLETIISQDDAGKRITAPLGAKILVRLKENPSTGYTWKLTGTEGASVSFQRASFAAKTQAALGSDGVRTLAFLALSNGCTRLQFEHKRSWESDEKALERFEVTVCVET
jgi:inhibitor of cysteine peptidase